MHNALLYIGGLIGLLTFIVNVFENRKQGRQKRIELYLEMGKRLETNPDFLRVRSSINTNSDDIRNIPKKLRSDYAGFFESIALMMNSGLISREVACYMFSYDASACWKNGAFWEDFIRDDANWGLLRQFIEEMDSMRPRVNAKNIRL